MAICPYCFNKINLNKVDMRCARKTCLDAGTTNRHLIPRSLAKVDRKGYGECNVCHTGTHIFVCSECHQDLPDTIKQSETKVISIVGATGSGKSYFVAALLRQLMDEGLLARVNSAATRFPPGNREMYQRRYKEYLDKRIPLAPTNFANDLIKDNPPILVQLTYTNERNKKVDNTYSFFDAAGESFKTEADLAAITPYISHSEAIIILLDPRQIEKVNLEVSAAIPNLPAVANEKYEDIINSVTDVLYSSLRLNRRKKIRIPLCVAFSKWDLLIHTPNLLPDDFIVSKPSRTSVTGFDANMVENASAEIRSLLNEWDPNFLVTVENKFETVRYFGFSAWGPGSKNGKEIPAIASFRVEDPMLWIMYHNKLL